MSLKYNLKNNTYKIVSFSLSIRTSSIGGRYSVSFSNKWNGFMMLNSLLICCCMWITCWIFVPSMKIQQNRRASWKNLDRSTFSRKCGRFIVTSSTSLSFAIAEHWSRCMTGINSNAIVNYTWASLMVETSVFFAHVQWLQQHVSRR